MKKNKKKNVKMKKNIIITLITLIIISSLCLLILIVINNIKPKNTIKIVDEIKEYGYILESNETDLYKSLFNNLSKVLDEKNLNYKEYAKLVSQLFVVDFYNLDNKITKNDVGGTQFILSDKQDNFLLKAKDTIYKNIKNNVYNDRKQELPIVKDVIIKEIEDTEYEFDDKKFKGYIINLSIEYKKDLGYDKEKEIILIKNDKKIEIVELK